MDTAVADLARELRYMKAMVVARTPRSAWIEAGLRALAAGGPDAVRIEALARTLRVTKGGFYWHFDNRRALLDDILDAWERLVVDEVIKRIEDGLGEGTGRAKAKRSSRAWSVMRFRS